MAERRKRFLMWLLPKLIVFAVGIGLGYYVRDRQQDDLRDAYQEAMAELKELRAAGEDVVERGRRAGEGLRAGAKAAADSTREAVREIVGDSGR